jgi:hypothetical protein
MRLGKRGAACVLLIGALLSGCVFTSSTEYSVVSGSAGSGSNEIEIRDFADSSTSPTRLAGKWDARSQRGNSDFVQIKLVTTHNGSTNVSNYGSADRDQLKKLTHDNGPVHVTVGREAGTLTFDGAVKDGHGSGEVTFDADPNYLAEMGKLTGETITARRALELSLVDLRLDYARRMADAGYRFSTDELLGLKFAGVSADDAKKFRDAGYQFSADDLRGLRFGGVDASWAKKLRDAGYDFSASDLRSLRFGGVDADDAARFRRAGYRLSADELRGLRFTGVSASYAADLAAAGYKFTPEELSRLRFTGVGEDYAVALKKAGYEFSAEQLARLRFSGVSSDYACDVAIPGRANLSADELINLRRRGIDAETVRKLRQ